MSIEEWRLQMNDKTKSLLKKWGIGGVLIAALIPIALNLLMLPQAGAAGQPDTWITFFGSYVGSILSGLLTLIGVLLTINYTVEQNKINQKHADEANLRQLDFTREENKKILEENQRESRRNKLPEMIYNLEECLDFFDTCLETLNELIQIDLYELAHAPPHKWSLYMFEIDDNYKIIGNYKYRQATKEWLKAIRNLSVKADTPAYEAFLDLQSMVQEAHNRNISPLLKKFDLFRSELIEVYGEKYPTVISKDFKLSYLELNNKHRIELRDLKVELNRQEGLYMSGMLSAYAKIQEKMQQQLYDLIKEFSTS